MDSKGGKKSQPPAPPADDFADWQLADELANWAEALARDAFTVAADGQGLHPSDMQIEVSQALRKTAKLRLKKALKGFQKP